MPIAPLLLAAQLAAAPACRAAQLRLTLDAHDGAYDGMSHSGTEVSLRNLGPDCTLPAYPTIGLRDARGRALSAGRSRTPGPASAPVRLGGGHRAACELRWVSAPVYPHNRRLHVARLTVRIGDGTLLHAAWTATLYGPAGRTVLFGQTALRPMEGMPADTA